MSDTVNKKMTDEQKKHAIKKMEKTIAYRAAKSMHSLKNKSAMMDILEHMDDTGQLLAVEADNNLSALFSDGSALLLRPSDADKSMNIVPLTANSILRILDAHFPFEKSGELCIRKV